MKLNIQTFFLHCSIISSNVQVLSLRVVLCFNDVEKRDVEQHLVAVVPAVEGAVPGIVVQHGHVEVLVVKGNVCVFVRGGLGGVGVVHLGARQVGISDVQRPADHEGLTGVSL